MEETKLTPDQMLPPAVGKKEKAAKETKEKGVSRKEFEGLQNQVSTGFAAIMEKLESAPKVTVDSSGLNVAAAKPDEAGPQTPSLVPPAWRALADEILGPDFEIELELPENGGQKFTIYVPMDKSNASADYKKFYKRDRRTRELANTGVKGVKDWLLKVRRNILKSGIKLPYYEDNQPQLISTR